MTDKRREWNINRSPGCARFEPACSLATAFADNPPSTARQKTRWTSGAAGTGISYAGLEPAPDFRPSALSWRAASPTLTEDNLQRSAHRNWGDQPDSHRHKRLHGA